MDTQDIEQFPPKPTERLVGLEIGESVLWPGAYYWRANNARQNAERKTGFRFKVGRAGLGAVQVTRTK